MDKSEFVPRFVLDYKDLESKFSKDEDSGSLSIGQLEICMKNWIYEILSELAPLSPAPSKLFYTRKEACELLSVSNATLHKLINTGLPSHKIGGKTVLFRDEIIAQIKKNKIK